MQYQLIQDALTSLINCIAISGGVIASTTIVYKHWMQYPQMVSEGTFDKNHNNKTSSTSRQPSSKQPQKSYQNKTQLQSLVSEEQQNQREHQLQQQLSLTEERLQQTQQELEQSHQNKLQLQNCLDAVKLELQQAQQKEQQNQRQLCQLQQQLSLTEEQLRQTQQELENTKGGLQGFVNQIFHLDRSAKVKLKDFLFNKQLIQVIQPANE